MGHLWLFSVFKVSQQSMIHIIIIISCVVCTDGSVRLLQENGTVVYNSSTVYITGIVEVCVEGYWASVCDLYPIDPIGPEVVCQSLGYDGMYIQ